MYSAQIEQSDWTVWTNHSTSIYVTCSVWHTWVSMFVITYQLQRVRSEMQGEILWNRRKIRASEGHRDCFWVHSLLNQATHTNTHHTCTDTPHACTDTPHTCTSTHHTCTDTPHTCTDTPHTCTSTHHTCTDTPHTCTSTHHTCTDTPHTCAHGLIPALLCCEADVKYYLLLWATSSGVSSEPYKVKVQSFKMLFFLVMAGNTANRTSNASTLAWLTITQMWAVWTWSRY